MGTLDGFRTLLNIRRDRKIGPAGPKPRQGAKVVLHDARLTVPAGLTDAHWKWLGDLGFREVNVKLDRRRYRDIGSAYMQRLVDAPEEEWRPLLKEAIREAVARPVVSRRTVARVS
jgi:hypothetical protein